MGLILLLLIAGGLLIWAIREKKGTQALLGLVTLGGIVAFFMGARAFDIYHDWPGALLIGIGLAAILGTAVAVKVLYYREKP